MNVDKTAFLRGMGRTVASVCVVTTAGRSGPAGLTVNSVVSFAADPPSLLVCIRRDAGTAAAILDNGVFCINVLHAGHQQVADIFAGRHDVADRFATGDWRPAASGCPELSDAVARFDCALIHTHSFGSHSMFIGEVRNVSVDEAPRTLAYHDRAYGLFHPATA